MPSATTFGLFAVAAIVLLLIPGPAVLYIVTRSIDQGRAAGLASVLGVTTGTLIQIAFAVVGLSSLVLASAIAFDVVKYAGAVYLVFLGVKRLLSRDHAALQRSREPRTLRRLYTQGVIVNTLNPKTALFVFALLPQFVDPHAARPWLQTLVLGLSFTVLAFLSDSLYAVAAGSIADRLRGTERIAWVQRWIGGSVLVGLGILSAAWSPSGASR
jgi:threonine/homoserine/homoserine lactone efflux protein